MDQQDARVREPVVSIIIPCYNYGDYLPALFRSLTEQEFTSWECWLVDDGSSDNTKQNAAHFAATDSRINYVRQENQGQAVARNTGLLRARGSFIQFLDADDLLEPRKIAVQVALLLDSPAIDIIYGSVRYFSGDDPGVRFMNRWGEQDARWILQTDDSMVTMMKAFIEKNVFELGCALFRKQAIRHIGYFNPLLQGVEDYDFCFRAAARGLRFRFMEEDGTHILMRHHPGSYSKNLIRMYKQELRFRKTVRQTLMQSGDRSFARLNQEKYDTRLRRLQDETIDQVRKGDRKLLNFREFIWHIRYSNVRQQLYFFSRILKAIFSKERATSL